MENSPDPTNYSSNTGRSGQRSNDTPRYNPNLIPSRPLNPPSPFQPGGQPGAQNMYLYTNPAHYIPIPYGSQWIPTRPPNPLLGSSPLEPVGQTGAQSMYPHANPEPQNTPNSHRRPRPSNPPSRTLLSHGVPLNQFSPQHNQEHYQRSQYSSQHRFSQPSQQRFREPKPRNIQHWRQEAPRAALGTSSQQYMSNIQSSSNIKEKEMMEPLTRDNYKLKFNALLDKEERIHGKVLLQKCNGSYCVKPFTRQNHNFPPWLRLDYYRHILEIHGLTEDILDYAKQASTSVSLQPGNVEGSIVFKDFSQSGSPVLLIGLENIPKILRNNLEDTTEDDFSPNITVVFSLKEFYFKGLRSSVNELNHSLIKKLVPQSEEFQLCNRGVDPTSIFIKKPPHPVFELDKEYQEPALQKILASPSSVPFLIIGPFGTGKTRLLASAAQAILRGEGNQFSPESNIRVLIATHHNQTADSYLENYYKPAADYFKEFKFVRVAAEGGVRPNSGNLVKSVHQIGNNIQKYHLVITTLLTAKQLSRYCKNFFSHILIDEVAQAREPEVLAALKLAGENTKIILAGDPLQVGPATLVIGDIPKNHGLGVSLLERLRTRYLSHAFRDIAEKHCVAFLRSNYRSHSGILDFMSSLFYDPPIHSKSKNLLHPKCKHPLYFVCTSLEQGDDCLLSAEEQLKLECQNEADQVLQAVRKYCIPWPHEWCKPWKCDYLKTACIIAPSRMQARMIKTRIKEKYRDLSEIHVTVAFDIQGLEYTAVFLCTSEPVSEDGKIANPTKSICDKYVFNTVITRAESLLVAVGNPFRLMKIEETVPNGAGCWKAYIKHCYKKETLDIPDEKLKSEATESLSAMFSSMTSPRKHDVMLEVERELSPSDSSQKVVAESSEMEKRFKDIVKIGKGGFGIVFKCKDNVTGTSYAVKRIKITSKRSADDAIREVKAMEDLNSPHIVRYFDAFTDTPCDLDCAVGQSTSSNPNNTTSDSQGPNSLPDEIIGCDYLCIKMELCDSTLRDWLDQTAKDNKRLRTEVFHNFEQILQAVYYIHERNKIHRDLKPSNVLFSKERTIKVGDFGLTTDAYVPSGENPGNVGGKRTGRVGTLFYMAPEVLQDKKDYDPNVDTYSLGVIFFEMNILCSTESEKIDVLQKRTRGSFPAAFKDALVRERKLIDVMLQRDPTKRPTVSELMDCEGFIELKKHISKLNDVDEMNNLGEIHITYNDEDSGMATSSFSNSESEISNQTEVSKINNDTSSSDSVVTFESTSGGAKSNIPISLTWSSPGTSKTGSNYLEPSDAEESNV